MNYEEFKIELQEEIQSNFLEHIDFLSETVNMANQTLDRVAVHFEGQLMAPVIYPEKLYEDYKNGMSVGDISDEISVSIARAMMNQPEFPELTIENAKKHIMLSLVNKEKNKKLLEICPHIDVYDMAAIPRWHISEDESFLVDKNIMQTLKMTREELIMVAKRNTESANYTCREMTDVMREIMLKNGIGQETVNEILPMCQTPFFVITNENYFDGSCAILSNTFMQKVSEKLGCEELYILPSSRHEMLVVNPNLPLEPQDLKAMVVEVNGDLKAIKTEDFLSNSVYKYNTKNYTLSVCDSKGLFLDKGNKKESVKRDSGKGRKL